MPTLKLYVRTWKIFLSYLTDLMVDRFSNAYQCNMRQCVAYRIRYVSRSKVKITRSNIKYIVSTPSRPRLLMYYFKLVSTSDVYRTLFRHVGQKSRSRGQFCLCLSFWNRVISFSRDCCSYPMF